MANKTRWRCCRTALWWPVALTGMPARAALNRGFDSFRTASAGTHGLHDLPNDPDRHAQQSDTRSEAAEHAKRCALPVVQHVRSLPVRSWISCDPPGGNADEDENGDACDNKSDQPLACQADRKLFHVGISPHCARSIVAQIQHGVGSGDCRPRLRHAIGISWRPRHEFHWPALRSKQNCHLAGCWSCSHWRSQMPPLRDAHFDLVPLAERVMHIGRRPRMSPRPAPWQQVRPSNRPVYISSAPHFLRDRIAWRSRFSNIAKISQ